MAQTLRVLEREHDDLREKVNVLGTAAAVAAAETIRADARFRRMYALAGIALTGLNVGVAVATTWWS